MNAEIIAIGDELLIGQVINSNAAWIAQELNLIGISVAQLSTIGDSVTEIKRGLTDASHRAEVIICTGGLGPTKDDLTKQAVCEFFNATLRFDEEIFDDVHKRFMSYGLPMIESNRKQAEIPERCEPIRNLNGTAPGMWFDAISVQAQIIFLPGVPYEMKEMMKENVLPRLKKITNEKKRMGEGSAIYHFTVNTTGKGESFLAQKIAHWETELPSTIKLAYLPSPGIVRLRLSATGSDVNDLKNKVGGEVKKLRRIIPEYIFGFNDETLETVTGKLLIREKKSLSTAESCTGGYIAHRITSVAGSSAYFKGSVVAYSNEIKKKEFNISERTLKNQGAVSEEVVKKMALGVRKNFRTDYSIACSGIAGPSGGTKDKPAGTVWIAVAGPDGLVARKFLFGENRERNIQLSAAVALNMLRKELMSKGG